MDVYASSPVILENEPAVLKFLKKLGIFVAIWIGSSVLFALVFYLFGG